MRTRWSVITAGALLTVSVVVFLLREATQAAGPADMPIQTWRVTMTAEGELAPTSPSVVTDVPIDFRRQHIFDEQFTSLTLGAPTGRKTADKGDVKWRRATVGTAETFALEYTFLGQTDMPTPGAAMNRMTHKLDAAPSGGMFVGPEARIESDHAEIAAKARALAEDQDDGAEQVAAFYGYVAGLSHEVSRNRSSALACLRRAGGDAGARARLLVALCRNRHIPARVVTGLMLEDARDVDLHHWAEAWVEGHWLPMCPTHNYFGLRHFPTNFLVLKFGDDEVVRGHHVKGRATFAVELIDSAGSTQATALQRLWRKVSFTTLPPSARHLARFLLLLPLAALIVSIYRTLVGVATFGTFSPALLGLAFIDLRSLPWGLAILLTTIAAGWGLRRLLDRYHLLLVPRTSVLLTLIVVFLLGVVVVANNHGVVVSQFVSLFPLVILTHLVERFCMIESEDGTTVSLWTLAGTLGVALTISVALSPDMVSRWLLRHPETLGVVLAAQFLIGRYTGYRVSEVFRFRDLLTAKPLSGGAA